MKISSQDLFAQVTSIEQLETRLELAAAKKREVSIEGSYGPEGCSVKLTCTISF